jgi:hypothetical protein
MPQYLGVCVLSLRAASKQLIVDDCVAGLTLAVCCILVTSSQARRISQRHDVVGPVGALTLVAYSLLLRGQVARKFTK